MVLCSAPLQLRCQHCPGVPSPASLCLLLFSCHGQVPRSSPCWGGWPQDKEKLMHFSLEISASSAAEPAPRQRFYEWSRHPDRCQLPPHGRNQASHLCPSPLSLMCCAPATFCAHPGLHLTAVGCVSSWMQHGQMGHVEATLLKSLVIV